MSCHASPAAFGPFDSDFDPFEDDDEIGPLVEFDRVRRPARGGGMLRQHGRRGRVWGGM